MPDDPFAALENAVAAVEQTAARLANRRRAPASETGAATASADSDRLAQLEDERIAIRDRLRRVRTRLAGISVSIPEEPPS
jgi:hypothetical protein